MIFLDNARILGGVDERGLLAALEQAFRHPAETPPRSHLDLPGDDGAKLLIMPSYDARDLIGVKIVAVVPSNGARDMPAVDGVYILMDGLTGRPLATLDAPALTVLRTAGVCALAASRLSRPGSRRLLVVGTGALVPHLVKAYRCVRALDSVAVWGRNPAKAEGMAARLSETGIAARAAPDLVAALRGADIVCCATLAQTPLIHGRDVVAGTHVDLVGSFTPAMREADCELFRRGRLVVDTEIAFSESGDLIGPLAEGIVDRASPTLTRLLTTPALDRADPKEITIFKTVGTGLADLAAARYILERIHAGGRTAPSSPRNDLQLDKIS